MLNPVYGRRKYRQPPGGGGAEKGPQKKRLTYLLRDHGVLPEMPPRIKTLHELNCKQTWYQVVGIYLEKNYN